ncbi:hypothetical protein [Acidaminococcus massiliensis]|jgi:hypothetical protein|uniref:hypothetical protein n=1 Tax=Acidaminococcus massiliensis TaxID=1852375 RepID=UPI00205730DF|nr:hypothetical protein [Acidaminococcus massiliensis]DAR24884.1 MAG TPA: hypothetical protein [Caudoviricetes sp.]
MNDLIRFNPLAVLAYLEIIQQYCDQQDSCPGCLFFIEDRGCGFMPYDIGNVPNEWDIERFRQNLMLEVSHSKSVENG